MVGRVLDAVAQLESIFIKDYFSIVEPIHQVDNIQHQSSVKSIKELLSSKCSPVTLHIGGTVTVPFSQESIAIGR
jgi:hypothetical protein